MNEEKNRNKAISAAGIVLLVLLALCAVFFATYLWQQNQVTSLEKQVSQLSTELTEAQKQTGVTTNTLGSYTSFKGVVIKVFTPVKDAKVTSPLVVVGQVPGSWSFEASFPISIEDVDGNEKNTVAAQLIGDWMTNELVPFSATLNYDAAAKGDGLLVLRKDNPSGLPENDDSITIPLKFE